MQLYLWHFDQKKHLKPLIIKPRQLLSFETNFSLQSNIFRKKGYYKSTRN